MLFGEVMARVRGVAPGNIPYLDFLAAGILAQSALFVAIFYGISAIWERDLGVLQRYLVSPGAAFGACARQGAFGRRAGIVAGAHRLRAGAASRRWHRSQPTEHPRRRRRHRARFGLFSTLSLIIACIVKTRERFMGIGQVLTMPIFFASNAIYPLSLMPAWLRAVPISIR